jgi:hypothetical protein
LHGSLREPKKEKSGQRMFYLLTPCPNERPLFALKNAKAADGKPVVQISRAARVQPRGMGGKGVFC